MLNQETEIIVNKQGGPNTEVGKSVSRYNAQKHCILRETLSEYENADIETIYNDLAISLSPVNRFQELLVENIASNMIRLMRISKAETEHLKEVLNPAMKDLAIGGYRSKVSSFSVERLGLYSRYQTAAENRIHKSVALLKTLQEHENREK